MAEEITRKSVLLECLEVMRQQLRICSKNYDTLEPEPGMEEMWSNYRQKCGILEELIHAYDSEPVRAAIAGWQREVMAGKKQTGLFGEDQVWT